MADTKEDKKIRRVVQRVAPQSKLLRAWKLNGGISAHVTALEIERCNGQTQKMLMRQHGSVDLKHNPQIAADEFRLLGLLQSVGVAVPKPYYLDQSCEIFSAPYIVIEYIEGETEFAVLHIAEIIPQFATCLFNIHQIDCSKLDLTFLPEQEKRYTEKLRERPAKVDESLQEGRIRDTLEGVWPLPQHNPSTLLHGDFWPGNILWRDGQLVAVIDWEDAALGDSLADVANSRLEILWVFGIDAMLDFTHYYQAMSAIDFTNLPYWDLCAALRPIAQMAQWTSDELAAMKMREGHRWFVTQAFEKLSA